MNETLHVTPRVYDYNIARIIFARMINNEVTVREYLFQATRSGRRSVLRKLAQKLYPSAPRQSGYVNRYAQSIECLELIRQTLDVALGMNLALNKKVTGNTVMTDYVFKIPLESHVKDEDEKIYLEFLEACDADKVTNAMQNIAKVTIVNGTHEDMVKLRENSAVFAAAIGTPINSVGPCTVKAIDFVVPTQAKERQQSLTQIKEPSEKPMSNIKIETHTFVNGNRIDGMKDDEIYCIIKQAEEKIVELENIKNKPKKLVAEIEKRQADIQKLVDYLDSK